MARQRLGVRGPEGATGPTGPAGPTGATGPSGAGSIVDLFRGYVDLVYTPEGANPSSEALFTTTGLFTLIHGAEVGYLESTDVWGDVGDGVTTTVTVGWAGSEDELLLAFVTDSDSPPTQEMHGHVAADLGPGFGPGPYIAPVADGTDVRLYWSRTGTPTRDGRVFVHIWGVVYP